MDVHNVSFFHFITRYLHYIDSLLLYKKRYRNYFKVLLYKIQNKYPFQVVLKNGDSVTINSGLELTTNLYGFEKCYEEIEEDVIITKKDSPPIRLYKGYYGSIFAVFIKEEYSSLPYKGNTVVDIGANIGDSPIYFASNGAKNIIALEPFPKTYEVAKKNIVSNGFLDKITLVLGGISDKTGHVLLDPNGMGTPGSDIICGSTAVSGPADGSNFTTSNTKDGIKIQTFSLEKIIDIHNIDSAVLKMDCEGCEYNSILSSSNEVLQRFTHMCIEYHYGYQNLKKKLEDAGFKVSITAPIYATNVMNKKKMYSGLMFAERTHH